MIQLIPKSEGSAVCQAALKIELLAVEPDTIHEAPAGYEYVCVYYRLLGQQCRRMTFRCSLDAKRSITAEDIAEEYFRVLLVEEELGVIVDDLTKIDTLREAGDS